MNATQKAHLESYISTTGYEVDRIIEIDEDVFASFNTSEFGVIFEGWDKDGYKPLDFSVMYDILG